MFQHHDERLPEGRPVCVIGAGYVGLTAAAGLAQLGHAVVCVESNPGRLQSLREGEMPIFEPGLAELVREHQASGRLSFTGELAPVVRDTRIALLCVGTPPRPDGDPDLRQIAAAARAAAMAATGDLILVVKSTVPPGSCEALEVLVAGENPELRIQVASNPEFLREGRAVWDFFHPDRVVVGAGDPAVAAEVASLYPANWPLLSCDRRSAELIKYAANTFLAVKISFANEVAGLCEGLGADAAQVLAGVGMDQRIGEAFFRPGPGYGGSCLPKDVSGLVAVAESLGRPARLARAAAEANRDAMEGIVEKLSRGLGGLSGRRIGVLGVAFKAGTDDVRFSPAVALVETLTAAGATVTVHDPMASHPALTALRASSAFGAARGADALVVMTGWPEYAELDPATLARGMRGRMVLDAAGVLGHARLEAAGLHVYGVGKGRPLDFHPVVWRPLGWALEELPGPGASAAGQEGRAA